MPNHPWERQNNCLSGDGSSRISPVVLINRKPTQYSPTRASECCHTDCIPCYSEKYVSLLCEFKYAQTCNFSGDRRYDGCPLFRAFKRQLYHASVSAILDPLRQGMTHPVIRRCPDGHLRRVIYDLVAFIADYPEQVMLTGIVQGWCPK